LRKRCRPRQILQIMQLPPFLQRLARPRTHRKILSERAEPFSGASISFLTLLRALHRHPPRPLRPFSAPSAFQDSARKKRGREPIARFPLTFYLVL
jgi:hypothetical protein